jgi:hypothetical protein
MKYASAAEVVEAFHGGAFPWIDFPDLLISHITTENVDEVMDSLPDELKEFAARIYFAQYCVKGPKVSLGHPDTQVTPPPNDAVQALIGWMGRRGVTGP